MKSLPSAIIAGAPKCGTTSVFEWLADHPEVCASNVKETYFLMDRESPLFNKNHNFDHQGIEGYDFFFQHCQDWTKKRIEATPDYLYQKTPLKALRGIDANLSFLFLLRKPSERAYSAYKFFSGHKSIFNRHLSFSDYIERVRKGRLPINHPLWPLVRDTIHYGEYVCYLEKWSAVFGKRNIHLFLFEDLRDDPHAMMIDISRRLEISKKFFDNYHYTAHNRSYSVKNIYLHRIKNKISAMLPNTSFKKLLGKIYKRFNVQHYVSTKSEEDQKTLLFLDEHYKSFNTQLASEFDISLDKWR